MAGAGIPNIGPANIASIDAPAKATPVNADSVIIKDSEDSGQIKEAPFSAFGGGGADVKAAVDAAATADYIGAASSDGVLRTDSTLDYTDGGNFVTLGLNSTLKTNYDAASTHVSSNGSDHSYIDQDVTSGSAPTFTANNFSDGGSNAIITTTQETNFETAYTHSQDNTQAHSDYLLNNANDTTSGTIGALGLTQTVQTLTDGATVNVNFNSGYNATLSTTGSRTMAAPTNIPTGFQGILVITCDATARTFTWNAAYRLNGSTAPSTAFAASSINVIRWSSVNGTVVDLDITYGV